MADSATKTTKAKKPKKVDKGKAKAKVDPAKTPKARPKVANGAAAAPAPRVYAKHAPRIYNEADWKVMTDGYTLVPRAEWAEIGKGAHLRLEKVGGKQLRGGRLERVTADRNSPGKRVLVVRPVGPDGRTFGNGMTFAFAVLEKVWSKHEPVEVVASADMSFEIAALKRRLAASETMLERVLGILEKMTRAGGSTVSR
jgi:hypothetical protein